MEYVVKSGESLWSIAEEHLGAGAARRAIKAAANAIADASGIPRESALDKDQRLVVPDRFAGRVNSAVETRDAMPRLSGAPKREDAMLRARLAQNAPVFVKLTPRFSDTAQVYVEDVALPAIGGVKPVGRVLRFEGVASMLDESALLSVDAKLGKLTEEQFRAVRGELGSASSADYDASRDFSVADFLPPLIRHLVGKDLEIPDAITLRGTKSIGGDINMDPSDHSVGLTMNCHATAWEAARAYQAPLDEVSIFYGEMITMDGLVSGSPEAFEKLGEASAEKLGDLSNLSLIPGDVVQFFEVSDWARMTMLLHSAVYVGGGLFFEKPNTEGPEKADPANYVRQEETPYRLVTLEMMAKPIGVHTENKFRVEAYRPKTLIPAAEKAFESSLEEATRAWAARRGRALGVELVAELEQGMGGNIRGEHMSALVTLPLASLS